MGYMDHISECQEHLLDDADVMTAAIQKNAKCMRWVSQRLRQDQRFVLYQVGLCGCWLDDLDETLLSNKKFIMSAVALNGYALKGAGTFRSDLHVVTAAVAKTGRSLEHASASLRADSDVV